MNQKTYLKHTERIAREYSNRILDWLGKLVADLRKRGFITDDAADNSCDDYTWGFVIRRNSKPGERFADNDIEIRVQLAESLEYAGTCEGVNWDFAMVEIGGRIVGQCSPDNYTPDVWADVRNADAIAEKFARMVAGLGIQSRCKRATRNN